MPLRFDATATGILNGVEYRVKIFDSRFSGTAARLIDTENFVTVNLGETDSAGQGVFRPREIDIALATDEDLSVITDAAEDDIRVELDRQDTGQTVFKGFIAPNQFSDRPLFDREVDQVRLTGSEGLNILSRFDASEIPTFEGKATIQDVITGCLNRLYPTNLGIQVGIHWYEQGDDTFALEDTVSIDAYREDRPNGDFLDLRRVLEDTLRPFGFSIQQTVRPFGPTQADPANRDQALVWWISQWGAYRSDGTIEAWEFDPDQTVTTKRTEDVLVDLGTVGNQTTVQPRHERTFERQLSSVGVTYSFPTLENYIEDAGLEEAPNSQWKILSPDKDQGDEAQGVLTTPDSFSETPPATTDNQQVGLMQVRSNQSRLTYFFFQYQDRVVRPDKTAAIEFGMQYFTEASGKIQALAKVKLGANVFLTTKTVEVKTDAPENETLINVDPIPCPIPKGARLPIQETPTLFQDPDDFVDDFRDHVGFLTIEQRAEKGSERLRGSLNTEISVGDQVVVVCPVEFTGAPGEEEPFVPLGAYRGYEQRSFGEVSFLAPFQDFLGRTVDEGTIKVEVGINIDGFIINEIRNAVFDNVVLKPTKGGSSFNQLRSVAKEPRKVGKSEDIDTRIGSGPTRDTVSSVRAALYGVGENPESLDVYPLSELLARERLRYFRKPNERLQIRLVQSDPFFGHEYIKLGGKNYRVVATEITRTEGDYVVTLLEHKNYGVS